MGHFIFDIIFDGIIDPLLDFFFRKYHSGKWHFSHLLPLVILLFCGMWWLGSRLDSGLLVALGVLGAVTSFVLEFFIWIPREIADWRDFKAYRIRRKKEAESKSADSKEKE